MSSTAIWLTVALTCLLVVSSFSMPQPSHSLEKRNAPCKVCRQKPIDIAFIIDSSSSVWPENFTLGLWFLQDFIDIYDISPTKVRVAAVTFGDRVYTEQAFHFNEYTDKEVLKKAVTDLEYMAGLATETGEAIKFYRENLMPDGRENVKQICVVLTDGNSQDTQKTADQAHITREAGIEMFAIGVGHHVSEDELRNIAGSDNNVMSVSNYDLLSTVKSRLAYKACGEKPVPQVVCRDNPIDISFVVDASSSIAPNDFRLGQDFLKEFVQTFEVGRKNTRISLITFGNGVYEQDAFDFDTHDEEDDVIRAIHDVPFRAGNYTSTGAGIKYMVDNQMTKARAGVAHIAIVLTDGQSQDWQVTYDEASRAQHAGIDMFAIGVGKVGQQLSMEELEKIAGRPDHVFIAADYNALNTIKLQLDDKTCMSVLKTFGQLPL